MDGGWRVFARYLGDRFQRRLTWGTSLVVGTLINLYGQLLVPYLRDVDDPARVFAHHWRHHTGECLLSIVVAYLFPLWVSAIAAAVARYQDRGVHSRALFPDHKPDPVFRAQPDGVIVDAGEPTRRLFAECGIERAQDLLGDAAWARVISAAHERDGLPRAAPIATRRVPGRFLLSQSPAPMGAINIYLTRLDDDAQSDAMPAVESA